MNIPEVIAAFDANLLSKEQAKVAVKTLISQHENNLDAEIEIKQNDAARFPGA